MDSYNLKSSCGSYSASIKRFLALLLALLLAFSMAVYPLHSIAQDPAVIGRAAQSHGKDLVEEYNNTPPSFDPSSGVMTLPNATININELFPGLNSTSGHTMDQFLPSGSTTDIEKLKGVSEDGQDMDDLGLHNRASLYDDANSVNPTTTGAAYRVMIDMSNRSRPDLSNDPVFDLTKDVFTNIDTISEEFGDCSTESTFSKLTNTEHIPDYKTCERLYKPSGGCDIEHIIEIDVSPADIVFLIDHSGSMDKVISDLKDNILTFVELLTNSSTSPEDLKIGYALLRKHDYLKSSNSMQLTNDYDEAKARIDSIKTTGGQTYSGDALMWATDFFQWNDDTENLIILIGNNDTPKVNAGTVANKLKTKDIDVVLFHNNSGQKAIVSALGGDSTWQANTFSSTKLFEWAKFLAVVQDNWIPQSCINDAIASLEEFCDGNYYSTLPVGDTCSLISGFNVCIGDSIYDQLKEAPIPNINKLSEKVIVESLACDYNHGTGSCFTSATGEEVCLNNNEDIDNCAELEASSCGFIDSECTGGATGSEGNCYVFTERWDCGEDVPIDDISHTQTLDCAGPIRCLGNDCLDPELTQSDSFARTAALLNVAQFMTQDLECATSGTCEVFAGYNHECKIAVGGVQDCCDVPTNTSVGTYINAMFQVAKLDSGLMALDNSNAIKSAYQTFREPIAKTVSNVTKPFTSYAENISGTTSELFKPVSQFVDGLKSEIKDAVVNTINDMLGEAATNMGADAATAAAADQAVDEVAQETAGDAIVENIAGAANVLMTVYTAYVVAVMVIQILYECEEDEFTLAAKRDTKSCTYVGSYCADEILGACIEKRESYCCFNSPLSRIVNEQLRPQLSRSYGDPKNPDCNGIRMAEVANIDWSQVNLGEWTALLTKHDLMPKMDMNISSLTGESSDLDVFSNERPDAEQRVFDRLDDSDVDDIRREAASNEFVNPTGGLCEDSGCVEIKKLSKPAIETPYEGCSNPAYQFDQAVSRCERTEYVYIEPVTEPVDWNCPSGYFKQGSIIDPKCVINLREPWIKTRSDIEFQDGSGVESFSDRCHLSFNDQIRHTKTRNGPCITGHTEMCHFYDRYRRGCRITTDIQPPTQIVTAEICPVGYDNIDGVCRKSILHFTPSEELIRYSCEQDWDLEGKSCVQYVEVIVPF